ncbi:MAG TPA: amidase [Naasia sp.]|jgi:amidase
MSIDPFISATALAARLHNRTLSPVEVAEFYLDRIDETNPAVNAIVWLDRDDVLRRARAAEKRLASGSPLSPFDGVPIPIKDLNSVAGQPNTASSLSLGEEPAPENDEAVELLEQAGMVFLGRSNSPEFGALTVSENKRHGKTRNPWNLDFTSGGSSGGASAAVAAGMAPVALASDGGGSIRVPSATTGLVGLKPSRGRVPGIRGWEHSTTDGAITRTVADAAAMLDILGRQDLLSWYTAPQPARPYSVEVTLPAEPLRIGLLLTPPTGLPVDEQCVVAAESLARALEAKGHTVVPVAPFLFSQQSIVGFVQTIISAWTSASATGDNSLLDPYIGYRVRQASTFHAGEYASIAAALQYESRRVVEQWGREFDVLLTPTMAVETPRVGTVYDEANDFPDGPRILEARMVSFTAWANIAGLPAISLPVHQTKEGMPVGAQLIAGPYDEGLLLRLAASVEPEFAWHERRPPLAVASLPGQG